MICYVDFSSPKFADLTTPTVFFLSLSHHVAQEKGVCVQQRRALSFRFVVKCFLNEISWINVTWFRSCLRSLLRVQPWYCSPGDTIHRHYWNHKWVRAVDESACSIYVIDSVWQQSTENMTGHALRKSPVSDTYVMSGQRGSGLFVCIYSKAKQQSTQSSTELSLEEALWSCRVLSKVGTHVNTNKL